MVKIKKQNKTNCFNVTVKFSLEFGLKEARSYSKNKTRALIKRRLGSRLELKTRPLKIFYLSQEKRLLFGKEGNLETRLKFGVRGRLDQVHL